MKPLVWMIGASSATWLLTLAVTGDEGRREVLAGMAGPLVAAVSSWVAYERVHRATPERLTNIMIGGLAAKMIFFAAYVIVMLGVLEMRPVPFMVSFAAYFIALHAMEALFLHRLLTNDVRPPRGERA